MTKQNEIHPSASDKVHETISGMEQGKKDRILQSFDDFKSFLGNRIDLAKRIGLGEEQLAVAAEQIASYLAKNETPRNNEEKLLQELWKVGKEEERHKLAHMLVRLCQETNEPVIERS
ncbi:DUF3243 domain-containing protein [Paenibacillus beijingensis]|uniref:DUF3243 domain-containing protein n=1 Tax=Paenibacillus beijingensis TaxID=1126833 RepID=A0A0D5NDV3_9BACL|nr:DUF3243 domain-containing protein [Paenibacillus beijingensis]AJY73579.1 hypothetical protein VN24_01710 [Paenibacillus beijingensis]